MSQLNKLIHSQILPYAMGDDEDKIRDLTQRSSVQMIFYHQRNGLRKFFTKRLLASPTPEAPPESLPTCTRPAPCCRQLDAHASRLDSRLLPLQDEAGQAKAGGKVNLLGRIYRMPQSFLAD
jgi:hypothetical protein